jgi:hypothetical protein
MRMVIPTLTLFFFLVSDAIANEVGFYETLNFMYYPIIFFTVFTLFCITLALVFALFWVLFNAEGHK